MQFNAMQRRRAAKVFEFLFCCFDELCATRVSSSTGEFPLEQLSLTCEYSIFPKIQCMVGELIVTSHVARMMSLTKVPLHVFFSQKVVSGTYTHSASYISYRLLDQFIRECKLRHWSIHSCIRVTEQRNGETKTSSEWCFEQQRPFLQKPAISKKQMEKSHISEKTAEPTPCQNLVS